MGLEKLEEIVEMNSHEPRHCDDYIRDKTQPKCLRRFLLFKRIPAYWQHDKWLRRGWPEPKLYATYKEPNGPGGRKGKVRRVRVTMASRFGDVGITRHLDHDHGYTTRVYVEDLTDFSEEP
jgi:hypothetical protein